MAFFAPVTHVEFVADTGALPMMIPETLNALIGNVTVTQTRKGKFRESGRLACDC